jgi:hypothetical protein
LPVTPGAAPGKLFVRDKLHHMADSLPGGRGEHLRGAAEAARIVKLIFFTTRDRFFGMKIKMVLKFTCKTKSFWFNIVVNKIHLWRKLQ